MSDEHVRRNIWFQLDGAPIHTTKRTKYLLNLQFPGRWMGHLGPIHFPPYSPDLTPLDFSFWSVLRTRVYQQRPATVPHLKDIITQECNAMTAEYIDRICTKEVSRRVQLICEEKGQHIEQL